MKLSAIIIPASPVIIKDTDGNDITLPAKAQFIRPVISWEERKIEMLWRRFVKDANGNELPVIAQPFVSFKATDETFVNPATCNYVDAGTEGAISEFDFYEYMFNQPISIINLVMQQGQRMVQLGRL